MHTIHGHATRQSELWCRASSEQEAGRRPPLLMCRPHAHHPCACGRPESSRSTGAAPPPSRRLSPSSVDSVHPRRRCWWCTWSTTCATSSMELIITIKEVLAVQLGNAASKQQMPPAYHHRDALTSCSLSAGCTLQVAGGRRATLMDVLLMPVARQNSAAACWLSAVCSVHPCVRGGGGGRMGAGGAG